MSMDYQNPNLSPEQRSRDLLKRMSLREKIGQLNQRLYGFSVYERNKEQLTLTEEFKNEVAKWGGLGVLYGLYRADPWSARTEENGITCEWSRKAYNTVQQYVLEHSRWKIPMLLSTECPHGHQALDGGLLPVNTAVGATFDEALLKKAYYACGRQLRDGHVNLALMSVLDVLRDPRWGRSEECYSEDPLLSSRMAKAAVSGMQESGVAAVAKHLCAQGECTGGVNASAARIGERELREIHLCAVRECCKAGVKGVMAAYNEIDGVYCHANPHLLQDILRQEMGFDGVVMADGFAVDGLDKVTGDNVRSGALALNSGVDISLWDKGFTTLEEAVERGYVSEERIDEAAYRVLKLKFEQGLFEHPYMETDMGREEDYGIDVLSEQIAEESVVLLKNHNILPLEKKIRKIAVLGANADSGYALMGDYSPPRRKDRMVTVLQGLEQEIKRGLLGTEKTELHYLDREIPQIYDMPDDLEWDGASQYDMLIVVCGGSSSRFGKVEFDKNGAARVTETSLQTQAHKMDCGEGMDVAGLKMPGHYEKIVEKYFSGKIPVISVCVAGRPYALEKMTRLSDALLYAFYPGPFGGRAIAGILSGRINPSGRLPVSIPADRGQIPVYYNPKDSYEAMKYCDCQGGALFSFGEGLCYGKLQYSNVVIHAGVYEETGEKWCRVSFEVENLSQRSNTAVPQLYIHRKNGGITARVRELKQFDRISLKPMERKSGILELSHEAFCFYDAQMQLTSAADTYDVILMDQGITVTQQTVVFSNGDRR